MINMLKKIWNFVKSALEPISKFMSNVVNFVLLLLAYSIGIGIIAVPAKLFKKHFLELKKQNKASNWHEHRLEKQPLEKYYRIF